MEWVLGAAHLTQTTATDIDDGLTEWTTIAAGINQLQQLGMLSRIYSPDFTQVLRSKTVQIKMLQTASSPSQSDGAAYDQEYAPSEDASEAYAGLSLSGSFLTIRRPAEPLRARTAPRPPLAARGALSALAAGALPPSAPAARARLRQCASAVPEARAVLDILEKCPRHPKKGDFPVIVVEGLDATGKTTVTESVKDALNAVLLKSPPACISQWRTTFDNEPALIRRTFYAAGNYILASEIAKASIQSPVIVDRYWHSTAAYAIATEINGKVEDLPPAHHEVYQWPEDLLKPDLVLLLTLSPEERIRRLQGRGLEKTKEEAELETNSLFRQKVEESYRRMVNPACQEVDASPRKEEVLKTVLQLIKKHCAL
ncbi:UMP-CMP kinase 2, mitochondrial [Rhea pennata]|uniref:UMP-CMP kinase 2, mitochondrial n=1 Tax=Rhea pennata TaxID=8795 RepID=UPI002E271A81